MYIYVCVCVCGEMIDFGKSTKMRKISGKVYKTHTDTGFNNDISCLYLKKKRLPQNDVFFSKFQNRTT